MTRRSEPSLQCLRVFLRQLHRCHAGVIARVIRFAFHAGNHAVRQLNTILLLNPGIQRLNPISAFASQGHIYNDSAAQNQHCCQNKVSPSHRSALPQLALATSNPSLHQPVSSHALPARLSADRRKSLRIIRRFCRRPQTDKKPHRVVLALPRNFLNKQSASLRQLATNHAPPRSTSLSIPFLRASMTRRELENFVPDESLPRILL